MNAETALIPASPTAVEIIDNDDLKDEAAGYASAARARSTLRGYAVDWADFTSWCESAGRCPLPSSPETLCLYLTDQARSHKPGSIRRRLSSINRAHQLTGHTSPTGDPHVRLVWDGIRRTLGTAPAQKAPILAADLRALLDSLPSEETNPRRIIRDRALLLIGFGGGFRRSELVALTVDDIKFGPRGLAITIRRSKTDQEGQGRTLGIAPQPNPDYCPIRALKAWLKLCGIESGPIFRGIDRHGNIGAAALTPAAVALVVKAAAGRARLDPAVYAGHSLRSGFATSAAAAGASDRAIMRTTGHRSREMLDRYVRAGKLFEDNASSLIRI